MHRIDHPTAAASLPSPAAAGTPGYFTEGDPVGGTPATVVTGDWANALQEEVCYAITQAGITLSKTDRTQLYQAIAALAAGPDASTSVKGKVQLATSSEAQALTDALKAITPSTLKGAFQGSNQSLSASGYQKLPGGLILQWGLSSGIAGNSQATVTYPTTFPTAIRYFGAQSNRALTTNTYAPVVSSPPGNSSCVIYNTDGASAAFYWFALGY